MKLSEKGAAFIARHEGFVSKAYRDPVGIWTIGTGFTNRSRLFTQAFGKIKPGSTITKERNADLLMTIADNEYGAAVNRHIKPKEQHHYDGATSVCFNCGPGAAKWKWAKALARGDVAGAARLLRKTAVTAKGRRLRGLVRRRAEEADLIESGVYSETGHARGKIGKPARNRTESATIKDYQEKLTKLGFEPGRADGVYGKNTKAAVLAFQTKHKDLANDGILGRATMAQIDRSIAKRSEPKAVGGGLVVAGGATVAAVGASSPDWLWWAVGGVAVLVVAAVAYLIFKHKDDV